MRPDAEFAMRDAIAFGPGHCPPDLFAGPVDAIVRGLKAHANTIAHARHVALEETYPRTRDLLGAERFHTAAQTHFANPAVLRNPLSAIGYGFAYLLGNDARDLANVEWAWLESHGATDAPSFDLTAISGLGAQAVACANVTKHPAARLVPLKPGSHLHWDGAFLSKPFALVTRPLAEVQVTGVDEAAAALFRQLDIPHPLGTLLELSAVSATVLVTAGALTLCPEIML